VDDEVPRRIHGVLGGNGETAPSDDTAGGVVIGGQGLTVGEVVEQLESVCQTLRNHPEIAGLRVLFELVVRFYGVEPEAGST
jgi:hypothetical protein